MSDQVNRNFSQRMSEWAQGRLGRTLLKQMIPNVGSVLLALVLFWATTANSAPWNAPTQSTASVPLTINYQGRLADSSGNPINNTNPGLGITFALYDVDTGGTPLWSETHANVPVSAGLFSVRLGSINPLSVDLLNGDRWLGVQVGTDPEMTPREKLDAVPYAMQASYAEEASNVPDGSITSAKLNIDGDLDLHGHWLENFRGAFYHTSANHHPFFLRAYDNTYGIRFIADGGIDMFMDANNDETDRVFSILHNCDSFNPPVQKLLSLNEDGNLWVRGSVSQGALVENNLQTPDELAAESIPRFSEGDVLCWGEERLELCDQAGDPLVQAVADANGKPIVVGAEVVHVLGPVQRGDLLVASAVPGYAMVDNHPRPGAVIAQAMEDFDGERGLIRAMIRKF